MWIEIKTEADLPTISGTKAVVYHGVEAWMYWNADTKTWHPFHGWRRNMGQRWQDVSHYIELPKFNKNS